MKFADIRRLADKIRNHCGFNLMDMEQELLCNSLGRSGVLGENSCWICDPTQDAYMTIHMQEHNRNMIERFIIPKVADPNFDIESLSEKEKTLLADYYNR